MKYEYKPIMWNHEYNHNLLFIGSVYDDSLEYIDLRENTPKWKVIRNQKEPSEYVEIVDDVMQYGISIPATLNMTFRTYKYRLCLGRY